MEFDRFLHAMADARQHTIIGWGFSRAGKWLMEIVREHSSLVDVAVILGGYPQTYCRYEQVANATELVAVSADPSKCVVAMVHFVDDLVCGAMKYPLWHAEFLKYMKNRKDGSCFISLTLPGSQEDGYKVWHRWLIGNDPSFKLWFGIMRDTVLIR